MSNRQVNDSNIKARFEQPESYFTRTRFNIEIRRETVMEFLGGWQPRKILDVGCGDGSLTIPLLTGQGQLTLLDRSAAMLNAAQSTVPPEHRERVQYVNEDFGAVQLAPQGFELIVCVGVLAYVPDTGPFAARLVSLLSDNGSLITECTDGDHWASYVKRAIVAMQRLLRPAQFQTYRHSSREVSEVFGGLGLRLRHCFRYCAPPLGLARLLSHQGSYRYSRAVFGRAAGPRRQRLGNECLFHFVKPDLRGTP